MIERRAPWILGTLALIVAVLLRHYQVDLVLSRQISLAAVTNAAFNVLAFATPLIVGLMAMALSPGGGFIQKLFGTETFRLFVRYVVFAFIAALIGMGATVPYLVVKSDSSWAAYLSTLLPVWWGIVACALTANLRVMVVFLYWVQSYMRPPSKPHASVAAE